MPGLKIPCTPVGLHRATGAARSAGVMAGLR
jgi:hypothetical protein